MTPVHLDLFCQMCPMVLVCNGFACLPVEPMPDDCAVSATVSACLTPVMKSAAFADMQF